MILLIDEYDVPLDKAWQFHYYDEMLNRLRGLYGQVLKSNDYLYFAVLTGCLKITKESIFTGLNNLKVLSVTDVRFGEYFGFSDWEVREMMKYYGIENGYGRMKEWYDGYRFGNAEVYCPWDVVNYSDMLRTNPDARPEAFWLNCESAVADKQHGTYWRLFTFPILLIFAVWLIRNRALN